MSADQSNGPHIHNSIPQAVLDPFGGIAGDMLLGALVDLGASLSAIEQGLQKLAIEPWGLRGQRVERRHLACTKVEVAYEPGRDHRHLPEILKILRGADLPEAVLRGAERTFMALARAEAHAHGVDVEAVHFHEVGAADAILDVCGVHFAMELLELESFWVSAIPSGSGLVDCAHGALPCPVPATLRLLEGFDLRMNEGEGEMVTPTGAALIATLGRPLQGSPGVHRLGQVGYGAGTRESSICRIWRIESAAQASPQGVMKGLGLREQSVWSLACELDDYNPQALSYLCQRLLADGVLDARLVPTTMKKGRVAQTLEILLAPSIEVLERATKRVMEESSTLGLRFSEQTRYVAPRRMQAVQTPWGEVAMKVAELGWTNKAYPEYEDCAALAQAQGVALAEVQAAAYRAWEKQES